VRADHGEKGVPEQAPASCKIHDSAAAEVELLESSSHAVIHVVDSVAPAVVSIVSRVIVREDGRAVERAGSASGAVIAPDDIYRFLTERPAGQPVKVIVLRLGQRLELEVRPSEG
jgi:hypothetical protein